MRASKSGINVGSEGYTLLLALVLALVLPVFPSALQAQASEERGGALIAAVQYDRPSFTLMPVGVDARWLTAIDKVCSGDCRGLSIGGRFDINDVPRDRDYRLPNLINSWNAETRELDPDIGIRMLQAVWSGGLATGTVQYLYSATDDFVWNTDRLTRRALYGATVTDALQTIATERGVTGESPAELVRHAYILVYGFTTPDLAVESKSVSSPLGGSAASRFVATGATQPVGVLLRLNWGSRQEVIQSLSNYFCGSTPQDCGNPTDLDDERSFRRTAFGLYSPPVQLVAVLSPPSVTAVTIGSDASEALAAGEAALVSAVFDALVDEAVRAEPALRIRAPIVATGPLAARVGAKEGVKRGRQYYAFRRTFLDNGEVALDRRGIVRATSVVDNRQFVVATDDTGRQVIAAADSSLFRQTFGKGIDRFDILEERPDRGIGIVAGPMYEGGIGLWGRAEYRLLSIPGLARGPLPLGSMVFVEGIYLPSSKPKVDGLDLDLGVTRYSVGLSTEAYLARGNVRVGVEGAYGRISLASSDSVSDDGLDHYRGGAYMGFAFNPQWDLIGRVSYSVAHPTWMDLFSGGTGVGFGLGLRHSF